MAGPPRALIAVFGQAGAGGVQRRTASVAWAAELRLLRRDGRVSPGAGWGRELELWVLPWWPGRSRHCRAQADQRSDSVWPVPQGAGKPRAPTAWLLRESGMGQWEKTLRKSIFDTGNALLIKPSWNRLCYCHSAALFAILLLKPLAKVHSEIALSSRNRSNGKWASCHIKQLMKKQVKYILVSYSTQYIQKSLFNM